MARALTPRRAAAVAGFVALAGGALTLNRNPVGVFYDDGLYAGLAWALGHGRGYVYPNLPGAPAAVHFPPLYPLVLAPLFRFCSVPAAALAGKILNLGCAALASAAIAWLAVRNDLLGEGVPHWVAPTLVSAAALAIPWLTVLTALMSEPLFSLIGAGAVALADGAGRKHAHRAALAAGLATAAGVLVRSIGVAIGVGVVVAVWRGVRATRPRSAAAAAALAAGPFLLAALGWAGWVEAHRGGLEPLLAPDYGSYLSLLGAGLKDVRNALPDLVRPLGVLTLNWVPTPVAYYLVGVPALAIGLYGLSLLARRSAIGVALVAYLGILLVWPVPPDRFLWAVLPWLALAWAAGAAGAWRAARLRVPVLVVAAGLGFGFARYELRGFAGRWWERAGAPAAATVAVLGSVDSLAGDAVLAADHEPLVWLYTGRPAVPFYIYSLRGRSVFEPPAIVHRGYLEREGVTHLLVGGGEGRGAQELERLLATYPGWLALVRRWPDGRALYAVRRAS